MIMKKGPSENEWFLEETTHSAEHTPSHLPNPQHGIDLFLMCITEIEYNAITNTVNFHFVYLCRHPLYSTTHQPIIYSKRPIYSTADPWSCVSPIVGGAQFIVPLYVLNMVIRPKESWPKSGSAC